MDIMKLANDITKDWHVQAFWTLIIPFLIWLGQKAFSHFFGKKAVTVQTVSGLSGEGVTHGGAGSPLQYPHTSYAPVLNNDGKWAFGLAIGSFLMWFFSFGLMAVPMLIASLWLGIRNWSKDGLAKLAVVLSILHIIGFICIIGMIIFALTSAQTNCIDPYWGTYVPCY